MRIPVWDGDTQSEFQLEYTREYVKEMEETYVECDHSDVKIRRKTASNGVIRYVEQCQICGASPKTLRGANVENKESIPDFDFDLSERLGEKRISERRQRRRDVEQKHIRLQKAIREEWWADYNTYLLSTDWRKKRKMVLSRANGICEGCGYRPAEHVHHLTYKNLRDEFLWELRAVCPPCHERVHGRKIGGRDDGLY